MEKGGVGSYLGLPQGISQIRRLYGDLFEHLVEEHVEVSVSFDGGLELCNNRVKRLSWLKWLTLGLLMSLDQACELFMQAHLFLATHVWNWRSHMICTMS